VADDCWGGGAFCRTKVGRFLGKAICDGVVVDLPLASFFLSKLLGRYNFFDELATLDPDLYKNLVFMKHYSGDVADLGLYFSLDEDDGTGKVLTKDLIPQGRDIAVTNTNRMQYVHLVADYWLNGRMEKQAKALVRGFHEVMPVEWLKLFSPAELGMLITGRRGNGSEDEDIDLDDLQKNVSYENGYSTFSRTVRSFWKVVKELTPAERRNLVKFITGYPRAPLMGFKALNPPITISRVDAGPAERDSGVLGWFSDLVGLNRDERLPTAAVCFNRLKLPDYKTSNLLREKLRYAINSVSGFELS